MKLLQNMKIECYEKIAKLDNVCLLLLLRWGLVSVSKQKKNIKKLKTFSERFISCFIFETENLINIYTLWKIESNKNFQKE